MKKVNAVTIIRRLFTRFKLQESEPQTFELNELIQPVTNVDELLQQIGLFGQTTVDTTSTGYFTVFTVPVGKRYYIHFLRVKKASGTFTWNELTIKDATTGLETTYKSPGTVSDQLVEPTVIIPMDAGSEFRVYINVWSVGGPIQTYVIARIEDAY